jgi:amino acid transporter
MALSGSVPNGRPRSQPAKLRTVHLVALLIAAHSPLTILWSLVPAALGSGGVVATPLVFAIAGLIMLGFVLGFGGLGRRIRHPGGLYVQVVRGLGRPIGLGAASLMFLSYVGVVAGLYSLSALMLHALLLSVFSVDLPMVVPLAFSVVAVWILSRVPILIVARVLIVGVSLQIFTVVWLSFSELKSPAGGSVSYTALDPGWLLSGSFGVALVLAISVFIGSEAAASYSDELIDPVRSIPKATYLSYAVTAAVLVFSGWAISVVVGPEQSVMPGVAVLPNIVAVLVGRESASLVVNLLLGNLVVGIIAACVTMNNATARQLAGLARDGVLPRFFAIGPDGAPPMLSTTVQPVVAGVAAFAATFTALKAMPLWLAIASALGVVGVLMLASTATATWFLRGEADEGGFFGWEGQVVAGLLSIITIGGVFLYGVTHIREVDQASPSSASWLVGTLIAGTFAVGVTVALVLRETRPATYAMIGASKPEQFRPAPVPASHHSPVHSQGHSPDHSPANAPTIRGRYYRV